MTVVQSWLQADVSDAVTKDRVFCEPCSAGVRLEHSDIQSQLAANSSRNRNQELMPPSLDTGALLLTSIVDTATQNGLV